VTVKTSGLFSKDIISRINKAKSAEIVQSVQVGLPDYMNELVFFVKPEILDVNEEDKIFNSLALIEEKFHAFNVNIHGAAIIPGTALEEHEIMNRHYGFINQLSRKASSIVDSETRERLFDQLDIKDSGEHRILGGHEFLKAFNTDVETLSDVWFGKGAQKLRSGFYFVEETFEDEPVILINGFHPSQLQHFTKEDHRIYLMLLHTDTDWEALKFDLVGDTFPERAKPDSIRGMLFQDPERYGQEEVSINTNGVHLSAGPFEAAFEVVNFFGPLIDLEPKQTPPLAVKKALQAGFTIDHAVELLGNPPINDSDLFSETENMNMDQAVKLAKEKYAEK
jgi:hypothetical protein